MEIESSAAEISHIHFVFILTFCTSNKRAKKKIKQAKDIQIMDNNWVHRARDSSSFEF